MNGEPAVRQHFPHSGRLIAGTEGTLNTRDIGGYKTSDGWRVVCARSRGVAADGAIDLSSHAQLLAGAFRH